MTTSFRIKFKDDQRPILEALASSGIDLDDLYRFHKVEVQDGEIVGVSGAVESFERIRKAAPVLAEWLPKAGATRGEIVQVLAHAGRSAAATKALLAEFWRPEQEFDVKNWRWYVGLALLETAGPGDFEPLAEIASHAEFGTDRAMVV